MDISKRIGLFMVSTIWIGFSLAIFFKQFHESANITDLDHASMMIIIISIAFIGSSAWYLQDTFGGFFFFFFWAGIIFTNCCFGYMIYSRAGDLASGYMFSQVYTFQALINFGYVLVFIIRKIFSGRKRKSSYYDFTR
ncbi:MAG: hypothetical protein GY754_04600 [bacterium]|nr:hypothetical protein [bacterium]